MKITSFLGGAPAWVYLLLTALIVLGVRRLRTRETPVVVALIPVVAFLAWSVTSAILFAAKAGAGTAALAWMAGALVGGLSAAVLPETHATRLPGGRVRQPGSWQPLAVYLTVFVARFACGAWAAIRPADATIAVAVGIAISAAVASRFAAGVLRWQSPGADAA